MIGSHGRDRAEASGELLPDPRRAAARTDTARELVTILPRRQTREIPVVDAPPVAAASASDPVSLPPPRLVSIAGGVTRAGGPGLGAKILLVLSAMLFTIALVRYCTKRGAKSAPAATPPPAGARLEIEAPPPTPTPAATEPARSAVDAIAPVVVADAAISATVARDAGALDTASPHREVVANEPSAADRAKQAHELLDKSRDAFERADYANALALADQSLALRRTARTYLERARALDKLGKLVDALASIDEAMKIVKDYPPAWALRGKMLHDAHRNDEAVPALRRYLELDPNGKDAKEVRELLGESQP